MNSSYIKKKYLKCVDKIPISAQKCLDFNNWDTVWQKSLSTADVNRYLLDAQEQEEAAYASFMHDSPDSETYTYFL